mmetsp:Transcript_23353/g.53419  ORF Transcript_23353/g.53419 Transcript_23353/m.53419 type:complete len:415 (-) Transcript_23353:108-1352(-)
MVDGQSTQRTLMASSRPSPPGEEDDDELSEGTTTEDEGNPPPTGFKKDVAGLKKLVCQKMSILLIFVPLGIASSRLKWGDTAVFWLNFIALVPTAGLMGTATEAVAAHTGELIGGLINATFGNAIEMIVTWQALRSAHEDPSMIKVVQGSLLGSVLSNLLLVLGTAFLVGGMKFSEQAFNIKGATSNVSCLLLSCIAMTLPTLYRHAEGVTTDDVLLASRICAIVIASMYTLFLVFQLKTHVHLFASGEEEEEEPELSAPASVLALFGTVLVAIVSSELLVHAIEGATESVPKTFVGVILLPFVGNAVEHVTAVTAAQKNKMDLSIGIAVGSSTQIALFVVPFAVLLAWSMDVPMTLDFSGFNTGVMVLSVLIVSAVVADGYSNWLEGAMLVSTYILVGVMFFLTPDPHPAGEL